MARHTRINAKLQPVKAQIRALERKRRRRTHLRMKPSVSTKKRVRPQPTRTIWAKVLMIVQSVISLATVALLAARAINIL